jgi:hypothetical protein
MKGLVGVMTPDDVDHRESDSSDHCDRQQRNAHEHNHGKEDQ